MKESNSTYHTPALLQVSLNGLNIQSGGIYVDLTFGGGGHSKEIHKQLGQDGLLIAFDQDPEAANNVWTSNNFLFIDSNFSFLQNQLREHNVEKVDGILADLGVSSHQFDEAGRGFTIHGEAPLDMRMNIRAEKTAAEVLNQYSHKELLRVFQSYSDVNRPDKVAYALEKYRIDQSFQFNTQLIEAVKSLAPRHKEHKFYAQVFQAIRMEVNDELAVLKSMLEQSAAVLKSGGRLVIISYHSIEDRLVKNFIKRGSFDGVPEKDFYGNVLKPFEELNKTPIEASDEEKELNSRSRSAKLRIAVKK